MRLNLEHLRRRLAISHEIVKEARVVVAYADMANAIGLIEGLHGCPGLVKRDHCGSHAGISFVGVKKPLWWIASLKRDELERDGEVNQVKVEIIELQIRQRAIRASGTCSGA